MGSIKGKQILLTRGRGSGDDFRSVLEKAGAEVHHLPVIEVTPLADLSELDEAITNSENYYGVIFTSSNSAAVFFERLKSLNKEFEGKIFCVGKSTKEKAESFGRNVDLFPEIYSAENLADALAVEDIKGRNLLFPRGRLGGDTIIEKLGKIVNIDDVVVYDTSAPTLKDSAEFGDISNKIKEGLVDCIAFFSPSAVENFLGMFPDFSQQEIKVAVIGKTTSKRAEKLGLRVDIIPGSSTGAALAEAVIKHFNQMN